VCSSDLNIVLGISNSVSVYFMTCGVVNPEFTPLIKMAAPLGDDEIVKLISRGLISDIISFLYKYF
jgi:hypothetical protein